MRGTATYAYNVLGLGTDGQTSFTRDTDGALTEERTSSGTYYYLFDGLGSVVGLTDASGNLVATYSYDPYGQLMAGTGTVTNPWRFAGGYLDASTGLYKMGDRYYDPSLGRWTQPDAAPASETDPVSANQYVYVGDDPINHVDPNGQYAIALDAAGGGGGGGGGGGAILIVAAVAIVVVAVSGLWGGIIHLARGKAKKLRGRESKRAADKRARQIAKQLGKKGQRRLHDEISKQGYTDQEIEDIAQNFRPGRGGPQ